MSENYSEILILRGYIIQNISTLNNIVLDI